MALVAAAVALALLTTLAVGLAGTSATDQHLARNALAALQADALVRSGVAAAAVVLRETASAGLPDTLRSPWARDPGPQPLGAGWVEVRVEDEARRLDLHEMADVLPRLLAVLDLDPRLADALADWTDADDVPRAAGAERDWYRGRPGTLLPRNAAVRTVGELAAVRGFAPLAVERLRPYVTVAGEPAVNPNTAPREVLLALGLEPAAVDRLLAVRAGHTVGTEEFAALLPGVPGERLTTRGQHYTVHVVGGVSEIRRAIAATLNVPPGLDAEIVAWHPVAPAARAGGGVPSGR